MIPALRARLAPTGPHHVPHRRPCRVRRHRAALRRGPPHGRAYTLPVAILVLLLIFGTLVAAALPVIGGGMAVTVTLGMFWLLAQVLDISVFAMNVGHAAGPGRGHRLLAVHGRPLPRGAGRRPRPWPRRWRSPSQRAGRSIFFSRHRRGGRPARPDDHPVHVDALDRPGRRARGGLLGARRPDAAAGPARHARPARGLAARLRARGRRGALLAALVGRGHAPSGPRARGDRRRGARLRLAGAADRGRRSPARRRCRAALESRKGYDILQARFDAAALAPIDVLRRRGMGAREPFAPANLRAPVRVRAGAGGACPASAR